MREKTKKKLKTVALLFNVGVKRKTTILATKSRSKSHTTLKMLLGVKKLNRILQDWKPPKFIKSKVLCMSFERYT